jgi:hypothetical protein
MIALLNTNGYLRTRDVIEKLDRAGLYGMQISIDNVVPNQSSKKSLRPLMKKLGLLAAHARFRGFDAKCSFVRDADGEPLPIRSQNAAPDPRAAGLVPLTARSNFA